MSGAIHPVLVLNMEHTASWNHKLNKTVDFTLTTVGSVTNSVVIEKIGFVELLERMEKTYGFRIRSVSTDRHIQIQAFLEKVRPDIIQKFDVLHVSKSIKKKLSRKLAKCEKLAKWSKSIINHFWWCCRTCESDQKLLKEHILTSGTGTRGKLTRMSLF